MSKCWSCWWVNLPNSLRAAGDVKYTMYVGIGSMLVFRLGSAVLFGIVLDLGVLGVWMVMTLYRAAGGVFEAAVSRSQDPDHLWKVLIGEARTPLDGARKSTCIKELHKTRAGT